MNTVSGTLYRMYLVIAWIDQGHERHEDLRRVMPPCL